MSTGTAPTDPPAFPFIGGRACLDFVATLGRRHAEPLERIPEPADLDRWLLAAGLHTQPDFPAAPNRTTPNRATPADLADARTLREALYHLLRAAMAGLAADPADLARANEAAHWPDLAPQLTLDQEGGTARPTRHWQAADPVPAALATVARDAALLLSGPLLDRVKECENPDCSLLFLDDSQARRRRWCSMDRCGNLAKVAGYRTRKKN
ncbi:ABATE domain-containing protein [Kitasatospora aureofaciens]|uniref:CGNR zinc finger domain-containing protein n=1 Tax=Kitasatospora aureofaciens TaxID=1894 RepID=UPI001C465098|nr:ABATE domain-containing protein [Kitasatospora aureofaciens]MBV6696623.1 ABATE domain-containing protein [Kitasatospora aureofaciens]